MPCMMRLAKPQIFDMQYASLVSYVALVGGMIFQLPLLLSLTSIYWELNKYVY